MVYSHAFFPQQVEAFSFMGSVLAGTNLQFVLTDVLANMTVMVTISRMFSYDQTGTVTVDIPGGGGVIFPRRQYTVRVTCLNCDDVTKGVPHNSCVRTLYSRSYSN
jgi:hypothetical protein